MDKIYVETFSKIVMNWLIEKLHFKICSSFKLLDRYDSFTNVVNISNLNLPSLSLKPFPLLLPQILIKNLSLSSCSSTLDTERPLSDHLCLLFSRLNSPNCLHRRGSGDLFAVHLWTHYKFMFSYVGSLRAQGGIPQEWNRGAGSPSSSWWSHFFWCSPGYSRLSELQVPRSAHVQ